MAQPPTDPAKSAPPDGPSKLTETFLPSQEPTPAIPSTPSASLNLPPELLTLTQYQVLKEIGAGGMGQVYLAQDTFLRRHVVLKIVKTERLHRSSAVQRFVTEMQAAARLNHPNVVIAYTWHQVNDFLVFVMEYVPGDDLSKLVKSHGRLAVPNAAYYVHQVARGLQHAHENGLVHRDIKPSNLILNKNGKKHTVKILDFGLAKARIEDEEPNSGLTGTGRMLGTPDYVAPEQIRDAASADIRADLYSLGCTLYYLLAGEPPFRGRNEFELQEAHVFKTARPLNLVRTEVPVELANIVNKLMAKEPGKRYQTPAELVVALTPFVKGGLSGTGGTGPQPILLEEDVERTGEAKSKPEAGKPTVSGGSTASTPVAVPPKIPVATAIPVATSKSKPPTNEQPAVPTARVDGARESDDRRPRPLRGDDDGDGDEVLPVVDRPAAEIKPHIWWLMWGYLQLVFFLLVAGVAAHLSGEATSDVDPITGKPKTGLFGSTTPTKSAEPAGSDPWSRGTKSKDSKDSKDKKDGETTSSGSGGSLLVFELPALLALYGLFFLYSQPKVGAVPATRWADRKWWGGTFALAWLLGLAAYTLFVGTSVLVVVAFLVVLGLGAGIAVFLSRSSGGSPKRERRRRRDDDDYEDDRPSRD